jgi:4Fe-4S binding protein/FMN-binding protein
MRLATPLKLAALQAYRLGILVAIAFLIREHHVRLRIEGDAPITADEVRALLPKAALLEADDSPKMGLRVLDDTGAEIGYVVRTAPITDKIIGYRGPTDTLVAFDRDLKVVGVKVRGSHDTREHVGNVKDDPYFLKTWDGMPWDKVATLDLQKAGIEGVSGATLTSMAVAEGISYRLKRTNEELAKAPPPMRIRAPDVGLTIVLALALVQAFTHVHGRRWIRRVFQIAVIVYVGFLNGDLLAQSLFAGWAEGGIPWRIAPGLVLLAAAALVVPLSTRKPLYCLHICPHGAAQELLGRIAPKKWRIKLRRDFAAGVGWLPPLLLVLVLLVTMLVLPFDLAGIEPFDAYVIRTAGWATIAVAVAGLIASLFVPMAYCRYGCPTGALLEFVRTHGRSDRFGKRDVAAALMVALAAVLSWQYHNVHAWLTSM